MDFRGAQQTVASMVVALLLLATPVSALASGSAADSMKVAGNGTSSWALVTGVSIVRVDGGVEVRITADRPLRPRSRRLHDPERFVVDLADAIFAGDHRALEVDATGVKSVRIAPIYQEEARVTRVVVDLAAPLQVDLAPAGNALILKFAPTPAAHTDLAIPPSEPPDVAAERNSLAQRDSTGESGAELLGAGGAAQLPIGPLPESGEAQHQPAPAAISANLDNNTTPPAPAVEVAEAKPADDAIVFGVGVTGRGNDPTLGVDVERILGPTKKDKKNRPEESNGGEGSGPVAFHLSGAAIGGYYKADSESGYIFHEASPVGSVHLDASGYLYHPGFLSFSVKPQGSLGRQSSEGIFPDGRGVAATTTFLGGSTIPLTLSYSRLDRNLVTFGPLTSLAGLEANTFQDSLSANWTLRLKRMPEVVFALSKYSDSYEPLANLAPKTADWARLGSVDMRENVMGWNLQTRYKLEHASQDLINIFDPAQTPLLYKRSDREMRASADHDFGKWLSVTFVAGATKSQNYVQDRPFDQSYRFFTANSVVRPNKKLTLTFHGGVTDNVVGAMLERTTSATVSPADVPSLLVPSTTRQQMTNYSVSAQYSLTKSLHLDAEALRETTHPPEISTTISPESSLTSAQAGIAWSRRLRFVQFQSHYAANIGSFEYGSSGSSRSSGHKADLSATVGSLHSLELTASLQGSMQDVIGNNYMRDRILGASLSLSHSFRENWKVQATYNRARDSYDYLSQQFTSNGNSFSLALVTPRVELSAGHDMRDGLSIQADPRLQYLSSAQAAMLLGAFPGTLMQPTTADWSTASLGVHPFGKFRARGTWLRSRQQLQAAVSNHYTEWEASAGYVFRSLSFDAGYIFHDQNFGLDIFQRNRVFFRVVRDFTIF